MGGLTLVETRVEASDYNVSYNAVAKQEILVEIHTKSARSYEASFENVETSAALLTAVRSYEHPHEIAFLLPSLICPPCPPLRLDYWMADVFVEQPIDQLDAPYVFIEFINPAE